MCCNILKHYHQAQKTSKLVFVNMYLLKYLLSMQKTFYKIRSEQHNYFSINNFYLNILREDTIF